MPPRSTPPRAGTDASDRVAATVRELTRAIAPELRIQKHWGNPWYVGADLVFSIVPRPPNVAVEFWRGTTLKDPRHRLEGSGPHIRHVTLRAVEDATSPDFLGLLRDALRLDAEAGARVRGAPER